MRKNNDFFDIQRQSPGVIGVAIVNYMQSVFRQAIWPIVILFIFGKGTDTFTTAVIGISIFAGLFSIIAAVVKYLYFYYCFRDGHLKVTEGLINKRNLSIPREKIQRVEFEQNVMHRLLKVVTVRIETAGAEGEEIEIGALVMEEARALRALLLSGKKVAGSDAPRIDNVAEQPVFKLSFVNLIRAGMVRNHLRTFGIILGFFASIYFQFEDVMDIDKWMSQWLPQWYYSDDRLSSFFLVVPFLFVVVVILTLLRTIIQYFNFGMWRTSDGFRVAYGLFSRHTNSALNKKVQFIQWRDNILMRLQSMYSLYIFQAGSVTAKRSQSIQLPFCFEDQIDLVRDDVYPGYDGSNKEAYKPSPHYKGLVFFRWGMVPSLILLANVWFWDSYLQVGIIITVWLVLIWLYAIQLVKLMRIEVGSDHLFIERGVMEKNRWLLRLSQLQGLSLKQNPFEVRRNLASIELYTAAGTVTFPYLPMATATRIRDFVLYKVESNTLEWM
jgi:putative membrane protein